MSTATARYVDEATAAYRARLTDQIGRTNTLPAADPVTAGRRAAEHTTAGIAWDEDAGPFYDTDGARAALGDVTKQAVSARVAARRLLALRLASDRTARDRLVYPAWQFRVLDTLPAVLAAAGYDPERPTTGWTIAAWLTTPYHDLSGLTPLELLEAGKADRVVQLARDVAASLGVDELAAARAAL